MYAATGDPACREKAEALLAGWAECIEPDGYFYYSRKPNAPHYIYDKMVGGLTDMVLYCDGKLAAESLPKITGWASKNLDRSNPYAFGGTEWYTLSENLYRAHRATGDPRYVEFARGLEYTEYWGIYARNGDLFGDRANGRRTGVYHAYSHVNTLGGAARRICTPASVGTSTSSSTPTTRFWPSSAIRPGDSDQTSRSCPAPIGGESRLLAQPFETQCGCFAVFKLCKNLLTITGDGRYGDWIERLAYNGIAATIPMSPDGRVFYYSDYNALGGDKENHPVGWSCCTGTRPMALADLHDLVYFHGAEDLYVNLYVPSTVTWDRPGGGSVIVRKLTRFPEADTTKLVVALPSKGSSTFALKLPTPGWLAGRSRSRSTASRPP